MNPGVFDPVWITETLPLIYEPMILAILVFILFVILGLLVGRFNRRLLTTIGVPEAVEGTAFERTARGLDSSTVSVIARLSSWFVYGIGLLFALHVAGILDPGVFWQEVTRLVPRVFIAVLVLIVGILAGDKAELYSNERLKSIKLPEVGLIGTLAKYSIIFVALLIALGQIGVATTALLILLGAYVFGIVFLAGIAFRDLLASGAAGVYLILNQPYGIGDTVSIDGTHGIVQEVDLMITTVENDDDVYLIPNRLIFRQGAVRRRN